MKLEEQFEFSCRECDYIENAKTSVKIAEDFAIGFWEFIQKDLFSGKLSGMTSEELLTIYKKTL